ncbi:MAG: hypothetical protein HYZ71_12030 [Deltaproteobacteria bacterium]|nr:hypothetical protein [Deltaproteobacteria bacterium]
MPFTRNRQELSPASTAAFFRKTCREPSQRRVGIEIERIGLWSDGASLHYNNGEARFGAADLLKELSVRYGWPLVDGGLGRPVGLASCCGKVSLEPGSQLELSTETASSLLSLVTSTRCFEKDVNEVTAAHGLRWVGIGVNPLAELSQMDVIALPRYHIMTKYFDDRKTLGTQMMRLTSSVQVNLDYTSEAEAIEMLRVSLALTPMGYALFGNSPWHAGERTEFLSWRGHIWRHTDHLRSGLIESVFHPEYSFDSYAEHVWKLPLMFAQSEKNGFATMDGMSLADIKAGKIAGVTATKENEMHAIRQVFTETRLKPGYIEIRSIDGQRSPMRYAAAAFWLGILYSAPARRLVVDRLGSLPAGSRDLLWLESLTTALAARVGTSSLREIAGELLEAARVSLISRRLGEEILLEPLEEVVSTGLNPAQQLIQRFGDHWKEDYLAVMDYLAQ